MQNYQLCIDIEFLKNINLTADGVEQAVALLRALLLPSEWLIIISPCLIMEYSILIIPKVVWVLVWVI